MSVREVSWKLSVTVFRTQLSVPATPKPLPGQSLLKPKAAIPAVRSQHFDLAGADCDALKDEVRDLKRKLSLSQRKVSSLENENKNLRQGISDYLNDDQVTCLQKATMRGSAWSSQSIAKALKLKLACRSQGYSVARELGIPLPSERTLQRKIEGFKFVPGMLSEVIDLLRAKMGQLSGQECHAVLMYDEMQLTKSLDFDSSTNMLLGRPSVPLANSALPESCYATHALVFMLGGISTRWKQTVAYEFTGHSFHAQTVKEKINAIICACEGVGVRNIRGHLTKGHKIYLPADVVQKNNLPTAEVSIEYVEQLIELEAESEFRLAPKLKKKCLNPGHYEKMKVGPAYTLLNHDTAAAIYYHSKHGNLDKETNNRLVYR
ncbi:uncharacterized protein LOC144099493 isoform X1 [Amblyomma americanum]